MPEAAIEHARAAGDNDRVARLVLELAQPVWAGGRVETVLRWMEWLKDATSAEHYGASRSKAVTRTRELGLIEADVQQQRDHRRG
jgi:hypothetical protein